MTVLTDVETREVWKELMQQPPAPTNIGQLTKEQIRLAIEALDASVEATLVTNNAAIPQPQRGTLTTRDKVCMLMLILKKRFDVSV